MISGLHKRIYAGAAVVAIIIIVVGWQAAEQELASYPAVIPAADRLPAHEAEQAPLADKAKSSAQVNKPALLPASGGNTMEILTVAEPVTNALSWQRRIIVETYANRQLDAAGTLSRIISNPEVKVNRLKHLNFIILEFPPQSDMDKIVELVAGDAAVKHVSKDSVMEIQQTPAVPTVRPNDPEFGEQWSFEQDNDVDADLPEAWAITRGSTEIIVAVIDTGIDHTHPDLLDNLWINQVERDGEAGVDDDGNGYIDDIYGWDAFNDQGLDGALNPYGLSGNGHGTHVASIIGAVGDNDLLLAGVNWETRLLSVTACSDRRCPTTIILGAIDYVISLKMEGHDIRVINTSLVGGTTANLRRLYGIVLSKVEELGILLVTGAGNGRQDITGGTLYPALAPFENVITVGSIDRKGNRAAHSNYSATEVELAAPGQDVKGLKYIYHEIENNRNLLFDNAKIICDDFEPRRRRSCDNPERHSTARWIADEEWEYKIVEDYFGKSSYGWEFENNVPIYSYASLTHKPVDIRAYLEADSAAIYESILIVLNYELQFFGNAPAPVLIIEARGDSMSPWQRLEYGPRDFFGGIPFVTRKIPRELYTDKFQFRFSLNLLGVGIAHIDNVALTFVLPQPSLKRTTLRETGTSLATPHVAGAAALIWSAHPDFHYLEVRDLILNNVDKSTKLENHFIAGGSLNVHKALMAADDFMLQLSTNSLTVAEAQTAEFSVTLTSAPTTDIIVEVDVPLASSINLIIEPTTLEFTVRNWDTPQHVRIAPMKDGSFADNRIFLAAQVQGSQEVRYVEVNVLNAEVLRIVVPDNLLLNEGITASIDISLSSSILESYTVEIVPQDTAVLSVSPTSLVFMPDDWHQTQAVKVTAVADNLFVDREAVLGFEAHPTVDEASIHATTRVMVSITNVGEVQIVVPGNPAVFEGEPASIEVSLSPAISESYTVEITPQDMAVLSVSPTSLVFMPAGGEQSQQVEVVAIDDYRLIDSKTVLNFEAYPVVAGAVQAKTEAIVSITNTEVLQVSVAPAHDLRLEYLALNEGQFGQIQFKFLTRIYEDYVFEITPNEATAFRFYPTAFASEGVARNRYRRVNVVTVNDNRFADSETVLTFKVYPVADSSDIQATVSIAVRVTNTEVLQIVVADNLTLNEGESADITVALSLAIVENYTIAITPQDMTSLSVSPTSLVFTPDNWDQAQPLEVTAVADNRVADSTMVLVFEAYPTTDSGNIQATMQVMVSITNTEVLQIVVAEHLTLNEGNTASIDISLSSSILESYTVEIVPQDMAALRVSPTSLVFTPDNWNQAQPVDVTAVADNLLVDREAVLDFEAHPTVDEASIHATTRVMVSITNVGEVQLVASRNLAVFEGESASIDVALSLAILESYTVEITPQDMTSLSVSPTSLVFTPDNWDQAQPVEVTAVADNRLSDSNTVLTLAAYPTADSEDIQATMEVMVSITNTEVLQIIVADNLVLNEGEPADIDVALSLAIAENYTSAITPQDTAVLSVSPTALVFTPDNWDQAQPLQVTAVADDRLSDSNTVLTFAAYPTADNEDIQATTQVMVSITNTENLQIIVAEHLMLNEGETADIDVALSLAIAENYTVVVTPQDIAVLSVSPTALVFTPDNWDQAQPVQVTAVADNRVADSDTVLTFAAYPTADSEDIQATMQVMVSIINTEDLQIVVADNLMLNEGEPADIDVALSLAIAENYTIEVTPQDTAVLSVSPTALVFTPDNWDQAQPVEVTAVADNRVADRDTGLTFAAYPTADSGNIQATTEVMVSITNTENLQIIVADNLVLNEGEPADIDVALSLAIAENYTIEVTPQDTAVLSVSPTALVFTLDNWDQAQPVEVTAVADNRFADHDTVLVFAAYPTADSEDIQATTEEMVSVTNTEQPQILDPRRLVFGAETSIREVTVELLLHPSTTYRVTIASSDTRILTVSPTTLTFMTPAQDNVQNIEMIVTVVNRFIDGQEAKITVTVYLVSGSGDEEQAMEIEEEITVRIVGTEEILFNIKVFLEGAQ